jgi:uncharacterized protein (TIGR00255 family)
MTGFVSKTFQLALGGDQGVRQIPVILELKTLNSRYFETTFRLPSSFLHLEIQLAGMTKKRLIRGRLFFTLKTMGTDVSFESIKPVPEVINDYLSHQKMLHERYNISGDFTVSDVVRLPGAFVPVRADMTEEQEQVFLKHVEAALDQLVEVRRQECEALGKDLQARVQTCSEAIELIANRYQIFFEAKKRELAQQKSLEDDSIEVANKIEELHAAISKSDIQEEITRFRVHLSSMQTLLKQKSPEKGRRLDFTVQELHREVNTLMAKSALVDISQLAIDVKCELEKMREQIQNVV